MNPRGKTFGLTVAAASMWLGSTATDGQAADCSFLLSKIQDLERFCANGQYCSDLRSFQQTAREKACPVNTQQGTASPVPSARRSPAPQPKLPSLQAPRGATAQVQCDPATNAEAIAEARRGVQKLNEFLGALRAAGLPIPRSLSGTIGRFSRAVELGVDLADAAGEVDYAVQKITDDEMRLCAELNPTDGSVGICEAHVFRQWQRRNIEAVLDWNNTGSFIRRAARKWMGSKCARPVVQVKPKF
jgi:hypothetical protein